ncbi:unnamed protein product, partial [Brenthis ino]
MDFTDVLLQVGLFTAAVIFYLIFIKKSPKRRGFYRDPGWNYTLKLILARYAVKRWKSQLIPQQLHETPRLESSEWDSIAFRATSPDGSALLLGIKKISVDTKSIAEVTVFLKLPDGRSYKLVQHPETAVSEWIDIEGGWSAGGLKIQVLEEQQRLRIVFNGLLTGTEDKKTQHAKFNLLWASATSVVRYPEDWSEHLAAETLSLEPWRDGDWPSLLHSCDKGSGSWMQWGAIQGRFQTFDPNGVTEVSEYLRVRGVRERSYGLSSNNIRRSFTLTAATKDGTAVQIRGLSYHKNFTQCISGSIRLPNFMVKSITSTDIIMSDFCENKNGLPNTYTINVSAHDRTLKVIIRLNKDGGKFYSGVHREEQLYHTFNVTIDSEHGTGILELGYENLEDKLESPIPLIPKPTLKWLNKKEVGDVSYCVPFEAAAAACTEYVGGKGASLALLASVQKEQGYRVPPGFCITTKALNKQIEVNYNLKKAISEIEAANENYVEAKFKEKCKNAVDLFLATEIDKSVKDAILSQLDDLRKTASAQNYSSEIRFAVRSSAVGEDSEVLSAAGQNDTVLGCAGDEAVLRAVRACWASMFAFTSVYYRRQNGQSCLCEGGVVVQVMAAARVAGVMFTAHPHQGDPTRILITANYGLGESVVSGSVEPDTIVVRRNSDGTLSIAQIDLGSKTHKIITSKDGVTSENVADIERNKPCLSESEIFKLARLGVSQERLWGAGRDIEWAINDDDVFLLQARPITSLDQWTEEELLHELDTPIMSDDELITFANTGEVLPKPITPLTHDLVIAYLEKGISAMMRTNGDGYDKNMVITHNRCALALYNSVYRRTPKDIDVNIRMLEISIHGHKVADDAIMSTALHRRQPRRTDKIIVLFDMIMALIQSKSRMNNTIKEINVMNLNVDTKNPSELLSKLMSVKGDMFKFMKSHANTSTVSTFTQFIAMTVLLEGRSDFTPDECNEISTLLSSGDVLSAEVPNILAKLVRNLENSGKLAEFREQDPNLAMMWLKNNVPRIYNDVCTFLDQHGHRAIMELDLSAKPWILAQEEFMKLLMNVPASKGDVQQKSNDEVIASLKTPKKANTRKALRWIVPFCHRAVRHREVTKSHLILAVHKLRLAALRLGDLLVQRWFLPNRELVFYFRANEIKQYIETRDPALLKKAMQRHQFYPTWAKLQFAEMNKGWVEPLRVEGPKITSGEVKLKATSVCGGEVIARVCVVKDLSEIDQLQQGDVLVTHSTDIGWSPYFPLLAGIVTELGGLISHGAVIAREYGLPCIVGAMHATEMFSTGETVRLSGTEGFIEKVSIAEVKDESQ